MDVDVAILGGGPGGYTAAIRAAQLGAKVACVEKESELGGTCLRVGCIPTKAWVQTAFALKEAEEHFAKFGVQVGEARLDFAAANEWKAGVVQQMTCGVASLFKANGVEWVGGTGRFRDGNTIGGECGEEVTFRISFENLLAPDRYYVTPAVARHGGEWIDRRERMVSVVVTGTRSTDALLELPYRVSIERGTGLETGAEMIG